MDNDGSPIDEQVLDAAAEDIAENVIRTYSINNKELTFKKSDGNVTACLDGTCHPMGSENSWLDIMVGLLDNLTNLAGSGNGDISQEISEATEESYG